MGLVKIYGLACPLTNEIKYVGQTKNSLKERLANHISEIGTSAKNTWISCLTKEGLKPLVVVLQNIDSEHGDEAERKWIKTLTDTGSYLFNSKKYVPSAYKLIGEKIEISSALYVDWKRKYRHGDLTELGCALQINPAKVKFIIETRRGTVSQIECITNYYNKAS